MPIQVKDGCFVDDQGGSVPIPDWCSVVQKPMRPPFQANVSWSVQAKEHIGTVKGFIVGENVSLKKVADLFAYIAGVRERNKGVGNGTVSRGDGAVGQSLPAARPSGYYRLEDGG